MGRNRTSQSKKRHLVTYTNADSLIADQFRSIRTNIEFISTNKENCVYLFTSPKDGEGKSTIVSNLAISMAQQKEKVLLIDANLHEPTIDKVFIMPNNIGLANVLKGYISLKKAISYSDINRLDILTSGVMVSNPTELLSSTEMKSLISEVSLMYDRVLIDSPTILTSTETRILANLCEGVVLVVNRGKTELEKAMEAKRVLKLSHANLLGVIINEK